MSATASLMAKFAKDTKLKGAVFLDKKQDESVTHYDMGIPALNLMHSGWLDKGPSYGITSFAGKSKSLKSILGLLSCKAYLDADPDMMMIFYDSEGGASIEYFNSVGIDPSRVFVIPIMNIEELKFDITNKLNAIKDHYAETKEYSKFVWLIDSIGNLASVKEIEDALAMKSVADMTRAKAMKSLTRTILPYFENYRMHLFAIQHTYDEIGGMGAPKQIMSGGTGWMLASHTVVILGKRQIKDGKDLLGWQFIMNIEKSRTIREKSAIPLDVTYDGGIDRYSALLDIACTTGHVTKPKMGWYTRSSVDGDKNWRKKETSSAEFWDVILNDESFIKATHDLYSLDGNNILLQTKLNEIIEENAMIDHDEDSLADIEEE